MEIARKELERVRKKHSLLLILLHGSQIGKKTHAKSDIDIAVVRKDVKKKLKLLELIRDLSVAFQTDKIDISDITHADPLFLRSVTSRSKLLAGSYEDYNNLLKTAFHKYSDYLPYLEMEKRFIKERIKSYVSD